MANTIVWADIPVTDMDRAVTFYSAVLQTEIRPMVGMEGKGTLLPGDTGDVSADLALVDDRTPSPDGPTIYLNSNNDPEGMLQRAVDAGGQLLAPVMDMGPMVGSIGFFKDSEGNRIGVHKPPAM